MTAQMHEELILDGEKTSMAFCPPLPENDSRLVALKDDELEDNGMFFSTACWRRYVGTWEIRGGKFYLVDINGIYKLSGTSQIFADWFTGTLRIPKGEILQYVHMGYGSVFEYETHIKIEKGIVTKSRVIDNRNKDTNRRDLGWENLPGFENRFDGDDEI
ncbi:hypothetical protein QUF76_10080 [Desulfobacterales bacterium HSG16]|nr:hypothetical protein [Desulfobacterales bacterium HSG16]